MKGEEIDLSVMEVGVVGFDLISIRKERDNMRKWEVLRGRHGREVKGEW